MPADTSEPRGQRSRTTGTRDQGTQGASGENRAIGEAAAGTQPSPRCGHPMPDLKGGAGSIGGVCGFTDCCG